MRKDLQHLVIEIYRSFYSFERGQISVVCERDRRIQRDRLLLLTIPYYYLQDPTKHFFSLSARGTQPEAVVGRCPSEVLSVTASRYWFKTHTVSNPHTGTCIYHFITPMISDQPHHCFRLFTQVHSVQRNL